jgi:hypothetical protein
MSPMFTWIKGGPRVKSLPLVAQADITETVEGRYKCQYFNYVPPAVPGTVGS